MHHDNNTAIDYSHQNKPNHTDNIIDAEEYLQRGLSTRLLNMIAIGGSLGTGVFLASGNAIAIAGPGGTMVAYGLMGIMVYFLMNSLGEMAAYMPTTGSFYIYASKFVDPALGYALGWNYWYNWAITVASEISAASLVMSFWFPSNYAFLWCGLFLTIVTGLNSLSSRGFGEAEYWFSFIKTAVIVLFIIAGAYLVLGSPKSSIGFKNWTIDGAPFHGGLLGIVSAFMIAGFSFQGTELIGIAAGESKEPHIAIPKAIKHVFWRILLFFILSIFIITLLIPYDAPQLIRNDVEMSPFTLVFKEYGISFAASFVNMVVLVAILSAGNSGMYASTRMLWYLAKQGHTPKLFAKVNRRGVPVYALILTALVAALAFLSSFFGSGKVYFWLVNASSLSGFIAWFGLSMSHYRFRNAFLKQGGQLKDLPFAAKGYPYTVLIAAGLCLLIITGQNYQAFFKEHIDWYGLVVSYIGLPLFIGLYLAYKFFKNTKIVKLEECSFSKANER